MLVVDASAVAEVLVGTPIAGGVRAVFGEHTLHAPHLMTIEVTSALRALTRRGAIAAPDALRGVRELAELGVELYEHLPFLQRCLELADTVSAYDALYVALAEALDAPLVTCDTKLARSHGHRADVRLIEP